ncbi:hypothetical protein ABNX05_10065 [Lysinibacillus sp. M3]|uniref:Uncharacterized protein n=1 Tax=Lysinibacillus zambalensis TaxID=3160866 RepID=A0ABV1MTM2_9BACI
MITKSNSRQYQIGGIIILFLSSFIAPIIFLYPVQELLFRPKESYFFDPFFTAYIILMVVMIMLAVTLLVNFLVNPKTKKGRLFNVDSWEHRL